MKKTEPSEKKLILRLTYNVSLKKTIYDNKHTFEQTCN